MMHQAQRLEMQLWDLVVQRAIADVEFRDRLLGSPQESLRELGLPVDDIAVVVREHNDRERTITLPPVIAAAESAALVASAEAAYSAEPPSQPIVGSACCALSDPGDLRATFGSEVSRG
jgi:hypothetical protein